MLPAEQTRVIEFLKNLLPQEYYAVANNDFVEIHKIDVDEDKDLQIPLFEEKGY